MQVSILGKEFMIACPEEERDALNLAARYLDRKMREIHDSGKVIGAERCAIMAALNISHVLLAQKKSEASLPEWDKRLNFLHSKIDAVLKEGWA